VDPSPEDRERDRRGLFDDGVSERVDPVLPRLVEEPELVALAVGSAAALALNSAVRTTV
jgi:hypothetical protein